MAVVGFAGWAVLTGCQSKPPPKPKNEAPRGYLNTLPGNAGSPEKAAGPGTAANPGTAASPGNPQLSLPALVREVLAAHDFPPPRVLEGSEGSVWAVSARPGSAEEVSLALIQMSPKGDVTVEIVGCTRVGNAWPVLGDLFQEPMKKEAKQMEKQIQDKFRKASH